MKSLISHEVTVQKRAIVNQEIVNQVLQDSTIPKCEVVKQELFLSFRHITIPKYVVVPCYQMLSFP